MKLVKNKVTLSSEKTQAPEHIVKQVVGDIMALDNVKELEMPSGCSLIEIAKLRFPSKETQPIAPKLFHDQVVKAFTSITAKSHR